MNDEKSIFWVKLIRIIRSKNSFEVISLFSSTVAVAISFYSLYYSIWHWESKLDVIVNGPVINTKDKMKIGLDVTLVNTGTENIFISTLYGACTYSPVELSDNGEFMNIYSPLTDEIAKSHKATDWDPEIDKARYFFAGDSYKDILLKPSEIKNFQLFVDNENLCVNQTRFQPHFHINYIMIPGKGKVLNDSIKVGQISTGDADATHFMEFNLVWKYVWDVRGGTVATLYNPLTKQDKNLPQLKHYTLDFYCYSWSFQYCNN
ncbi:hypothetical protein [uncultured Shewanella sp.]|uniref:hypothetical protein n=1 Tax=uncultured Shewanella sp. TaxID=173975 RepID=UPI00260D8763|nr:hypothetical protein [uncultured Shewanella sp.]